MKKRKICILCLLLAGLLTLSGCFSFGEPKETDTSGSSETTDTSGSEEETTDTIEPEKESFDSLQISEEVLSLLDSTDADYAFRFYYGSLLMPDHLAKGETFEDVIKTAPSHYVAISNPCGLEECRDESCYKEGLHLAIIEDGVVSRGYLYDAATLFSRYLLAHEDILSLAPATKEFSDLTVSNVYCYSDNLYGCTYVYILFETNHGNFILLNEYYMGFVWDPDPQEPEFNLPIYLFPQEILPELTDAVVEGIWTSQIGYSGIEGCGYDLTPYLVEWSPET